MHPNALLELATELLHQVLQLQHPADGVVSDFFRKHRELGTRDRHALAETTYTGAAPARVAGANLAQSGKGEMERRLAVLAWQGNEGYLRAALSDTEQQWLAQVSAVDRTALPEPLRHNLPEWLAAPLQAELGDAFWEFVAVTNAAAPLDLRVNDFKAKRDEVQAAFKAAGIEALPTPFSPLGLRIAGKPALHKLDVFLRGDVEVQDEGSQLLALLLDAKRGEMVVDFCAGAGGKTLALGAAMRNTGRLYAFDTSGHTAGGTEAAAGAQRAVERASGADRPRARRPHQAPDGQDRPRPGRRTVFGARHAAPQPRPEVAAVAAVGAGTHCQAGGRFWPAPPGCSSPADGWCMQHAACWKAENEAIAAAFTAEHAADFTPVPAEQALTKAHVSNAASLVRGEYLRLWPHLHGTDGFFAAVWQRPLRQSPGVVDMRQTGLK